MVVRSSFILEYSLSFDFESAPFLELPKSAALLSIFSGPHPTGGARGIA
jgi:hypothetical protein